MMTKDENGNWFDPETGAKVDSAGALEEMASQQGAIDSNTGDVTITGVDTFGKSSGVVGYDLNQITIRPDAIPVDVHYFKAFGSIEREVCARWIIKFCRDRGYFGPFHYNEFDAWGQKNGRVGSDLWLNKLGEGKEPYLLKKDGKLHITLNFIFRCLIFGLSARCSKS